MIPDPSSPLCAAMIAQAPLLENADFLLALGLLLAVILGGGFILLWLDRWRKRQAARDRTRSVDALSAYRNLYDRGEISRAEYETIRGQLAYQMREEIDAAMEARKTKAKEGGRREE
jgi:hypothetical protein